MAQEAETSSYHSTAAREQSSATYRRDSCSVSICFRVTYSCLPHLCAENGALLVTPFVYTVSFKRSPATLCGAGCLDNQNTLSSFPRDHYQFYSPQCLVSLWGLSTVWVMSVDQHQLHSHNMNELFLQRSLTTMTNLQRPLSSLLLPEGVSDLHVIKFLRNRFSWADTSYIISRSKNWRGIKYRRKPGPSFLPPLRFLTL